MDETRHLPDIVPAPRPTDRRTLVAMRCELQSNQAALDVLAEWYVVFDFTGGAVPNGRCELAAINAYLESPFAADCISTEEVKRYRLLVESVMSPASGRPAGPRTLRCRRQLADAFGDAASEIRTLVSRLETALSTQGPSTSLSLS